LSEKNKCAAITVLSQQNGTVFLDPKCWRSQRATQTAQK